MPLGQNNLRGPGMQNIQNYAITDNPVFKVKIRSLATDLEQSPQKDKKNADTDYTKKFKIGDYIKGKDLKTEKIFSGKIVKIEKNEKGEGTSLIIVDADSKKQIKIDPTTAYKKESVKHKESKELPFFADSLKSVYNFSEFLLNKNY